MSVRRRRIRERRDGDRRLNEGRERFIEAFGIVLSLAESDPEMLRLAAQAWQRTAGDPAEWIPRVAAASAAMDD